MVPIILAYPLALLPFASLVGALVWMARSGARGEAIAA
jgi:hypothetical protein